MKNRDVTIYSIGLNVVLFLALCWALMRPNPPAPEASDTSALATSGKSTARIVERTVYVTNAPPVRTGKAFNWETVESGDYREYIANLRAIGCPEETIRDIITADVDKLFEARKKEMAKDTPKFKYWETGNAMFQSLLNQDRIDQNKAIAEEKRALLRELLGTDVALKPEMTLPMNPQDIVDQMLGFLPEEKRNKVMEMYQEQQLKMAKVFSGGVPDAEGMEEYRKSQKELDQKMAAMMSPQEYEEFQLTMSQTANIMRMQLDGFDPSQDEFKSLFALQKGFDDEYGWFGAMGLSKEERDARSAAEKELKAGIEKTLGKDRYEEYKMASDWQFKALSSSAKRYNVPREASISAWKAQEAAKQKANEVRANPNITGEQQQEVLRQIRSETEAELKRTLGDKAYDSFANGQGQNVLNQIAPPPPPQPTAQ